MLPIIVFAAALSLAQPPAAPSRLAVIEPAAGFQLIDHNGKKLKMSEVKEDVLVVGFIFTTCSGSCPATTFHMARVQDELKRRGFLEKGKVRLISITLDPQRDRPDVLRNYMRLYDIDGQHWSFLTGPTKQVQKTYSAWGMWAKPITNDQLDHPSRIFLVDQDRNIREIYNLGFLKTEWVVDDIELLLKEAAGK